MPGAERRRSLSAPPPGRKRGVVFPLPTLQPWRGPGAPAPPEAPAWDAGNPGASGAGRVVAALRPAGPRSRVGSSSADLEGGPRRGERETCAPGLRGTSFPPVWSAEKENEGKGERTPHGVDSRPPGRGGRGRLRPGWAAWSHQPSVAPMSLG